MLRSSLFALSGAAVALSLGACVTGADTPPAAGERPAAGPAMTLYVSPDGNDAWSGRSRDANAARSDGPLATLETARDTVRRLRAQGAVRGPVTVRLRAGTHRRQAPFVLGPEDSGTAAAPVVYESCPGEKAVLSGGVPVTGWQRGDGPLWTVALPEVKAGRAYFRQLWVNGQRRERARLPKGDDLFALANVPKLDTDGWMAYGVEDKSKLACSAFQYHAGDLRPDWRNLADVEVVVLQFWMEARLRIRRLDEANRVALFTGGSWRPLTWSGGYYVDNVFEGLDTPGAWYLDRASGTLYYHPLPGEDITRAEVIAPTPGLEQLVRLEGDAAAGRWVSHITWRGLTFAHTDWTLPEAGYMCVQAEITPPAAVFADGAVDCRIERCEFVHLGAWGLELRRGCRGNAIVHSTMRDVGAGCVKIGEAENRPADAEETRATVVADNRFLDGGRVFLGPACVWIGQSSGNTISHNEISGAFHWAVSVGWTWSYFPLQRTRDNIVEFNHIHHVGTGVLGTHGAIYALGTSPGTAIRNNYIHHVFQEKLKWGAGEGIILDNGCCGILVENNVVHDAVAGGFGTNFNCFGNIIVNNVFAYGRKFQLTVYGDPPSGPPQPKGEIFARNLILWREGPLLMEKDWPNFATLWDHNLYFREGSEPVTFLSGKQYTFAQWQAQGLDAHSVVADPLFVDPQHGDFRLRPESPAFALGFRPIDLSTVGPRDE